MNKESQHLDPLDFDRLALGAAGADERRWWDTHLAACARCARVRQAHGAAMDHFSTQVLPRTLERVKERSALRRRARWWPVLAVPAFAASAFLVAGLIRHPGDSSLGRPSEETSLGIKGDGVLRIFALRDKKVFAVENGSLLMPKDAIRFVIEAPPLEYLIIASVDGAGQTNVYFPFGDTSAARIEPHRRFELPGSIVLDDTPGPERVFAIFSREAVDAASVKAALQALRRRGVEAIRQETGLRLPATVETSVVFEKARTGL